MVDYWLAVAIGMILAAQPSGEATTDFQLSENRSAAAAPREALAPGVFAGIALVLLAGGGWIYQFRPQWQAA
jgi:hypothetical protein